MNHVLILRLDKLFAPGDRRKRVINLTEFVVNFSKTQVDDVSAEVRVLALYFLEKRQ